MADEFKPNSMLSKEQKQPPKRTQKVTRGTVSKRQPSTANKLRNALVPGDIQDIWNYIRNDVLIPSFKKALHDIICNGSGMLLGEPTRTKSNSNATRVSYRSYYDDRRDERREYTRAQSSRTLDYDDILFDSRSDAEAVLARLGEIIEQYDVVSVYTLYDLAGLATNDNWPSDRYGWTDLSEAHVDHVRDGWIIRLPRARSLK